MKTKSTSPRTVLNLASSTLTQIPSYLFDNSQQQNDNNNNEINKKFIQLESLRAVLLNGNALEDLPSSFVSRLVSLTTLHIQGNRLTQLPSQINSLVALTALYVNDNCLNELPNEIGS